MHITSTACALDYWSFTRFEAGASIVSRACIGEYIIRELVREKSRQCKYLNSQYVCLIDLLDRSFLFRQFYALEFWNQDLLHPTNFFFSFFIILHISQNGIQFQRKFSPHFSHPISHRFPCDRSIPYILLLKSALRLLAILQSMSCSTRPT